MVEVLFRPFDLVKWLVLGFAAWLAGLTSFNGGGGSGGSHGGVDYESAAADAREVAGGLAEARDYLFEHTAILFLVVLAVMAITAFVVLLTWISSRGKFIFLDGVVHNRGLIREPWSRFRRHGDSLFVFRLVFGLVQLAFGLLLASGVVWLLLAEFGHVEAVGLALIPGLVGMGLVAMLFVLAVVVVNFALDAFVVPIMYRTDLGVLAAWGELWALFSMQAGSFVLCTLLVFLLAILVGAAIITIGLMTCCVGFLLLMLPYIGTVLLLPILVTYRTFTALFLAEIEPGLDLFASPAA